MEEWTGTRSVREVVDFLLSKAIPCAPLYTVKEVVEDPHIADARRMIREVDHPLAGRIKVIGSPIHLSETPAEVHAPAPLLLLALGLAAQAAAFIVAAFVVQYGGLLAERWFFNRLA